MADIGGGSTEIVLASGELIEAIYTTDLGAVRLAEKSNSAEPMRGTTHPHDAIHRPRVASHRQARVPLPHLLIGSGGTFTVLASIMMAAEAQSACPPRGARVSRADVSHLLDRLAKLPPRARRESRA